MIFSEEGVVEAARKGDKAAFGKLVNHYYNMVYGVCYGVLNNREEARDVTQEVFLKAFRDLHKFDGRSKFKTWIYRVAANASIDQVRKRRPTQSIDGTDASDDDDKAPMVIEDKQTGPREKTHQVQLRGLIEKAMEELSPEHRAVLVLREFQELSYDEIAEALGVEQGTVMSRIFYARKKLKEVLQEKYPDLKYE